VSWLVRALATVGFLGEHLPAPGTTVGSLVGVALFLLLPRGAFALGLGIALTLLAPWVCGQEAQRRGQRDPGPVVFDEVLGQFWGLSLMSWLGVPLKALPVALGFALFRFLDVLKPPPVRQAESLPGGWGIVADDLLAGLMAGLLATLLLRW
jgi:phosphatidylglycerophosphatase A